MTDTAARDQPAGKRKPPKTPAELAAEPLELRYLRHIRAAVVFLAWLFGAGFAAAVIIVLVAAAQSHSG
jgi:hypothetical protein